MIELDYPQRILYFDELPHTSNGRKVRAVRIHSAILQYTCVLDEFCLNFSCIVSFVTNCFIQTMSSIAYRGIEIWIQKGIYSHVFHCEIHDFDLNLWCHNRDRFKNYLYDICDSEVSIEPWLLYDEFTELPRWTSSI